MGRPEALRTDASAAAVPKSWPPWMAELGAGVGVNYLGGYVDFIYGVTARVDIYDEMHLVGVDCSTPGSSICATRLYIRE